MKGYLRLLLAFACVLVLMPKTVAQKKADGTELFFREYNRQKSRDGQSPRQGQVTMRLLKSATEIKYGFNNGTVSPEYQYQGYITVTPGYVSLDIYHDSHLCHSDSESLSSNQYNEFLKKLYSSGLKRYHNEYGLPDGAGINYIEIKKDDSTLFKGTENSDIETTKGNLQDAFVFLLSPAMSAVYKDPTTTFHSVYDPDYLEKD